MSLVDLSCQRGDIRVEMGGFQCVQKSQAEMQFTFSMMHAKQNTFNNDATFTPAIHRKHFS